MWSPCWRWWCLRSPGNWGDALCGPTGGGGVCSLATASAFLNRVCAAPPPPWRHASCTYSRQTARSSGLATSRPSRCLPRSGRPVPLGALPAHPRPAAVSRHPHRRARSHGQAQGVGQLVQAHPEPGERRHAHRVHDGRRRPPAAPPAPRSGRLRGGPRRCRTAELMRPPPMCRIGSHRRPPARSSDRSQDRARGPPVGR